ncbi:putative Cullin family profile domain-containing protein [Seiridium cardinale]|uniref:Cullin family profile domain-containing protein n=1 Tax=Seiridium cardinale TaxID=138064 RepID=A0ABR2XQ38_9PEZI
MESTGDERPEGRVQMPPLPDSSDLDATWDYLESGIHRILVGPGIALDVQSYTGLYASYQSEALLQFYVEEWQRFTKSARLINRIFQYFNRHWLLREADEGKHVPHDTYTICLVHWDTGFYQPVAGDLTKIIGNLPEKCRNGEAIEPGKILAIVKNITEGREDKSWHIEAELLSKKLSERQVWAVYHHTPSGQAQGFKRLLLWKKSAKNSVFLKAVAQRGLRNEEHIVDIGIWTLMKELRPTELVEVENAEQVWPDKGDRKFMAPLWNFYAILRSRAIKESAGKGVCGE